MSDYYIITELNLYLMMFEEFNSSHVTHFDIT